MALFKPTAFAVVFMLSSCHIIAHILDIEFVHSYGSSLSHHNHIKCNDNACNGLVFTNVSKLDCVGENSCRSISNKYVSLDDKHSIQTFKDSYVNCSGNYSCVNANISAVSNIRCRGYRETCHYIQISNASNVTCHQCYDTRPWWYENSCIHSKISDTTEVHCGCGKTCNDTTFSNVENLIIDFCRRERIHKLYFHLIDVHKVNAHGSILRGDFECSINKTCVINVRAIVWNDSKFDCNGTCYIDTYNFPIDHIPYSMKNSKYCMDYSRLIIWNLISTVYHACLWNIVVFIFGIHENCDKLLKLVNFKQRKTPQRAVGNVNVNYNKKLHICVKQYRSKQKQKKKRKTNTKSKMKTKKKKENIKQRHIKDHKRLKNSYTCESYIDYQVPYINKTTSTPRQQKFTAKVNSLELCVKQLKKIIKPDQLIQDRTNTFQATIDTIYHYKIYLPDGVVSIIFDFVYGTRTLYQLDDFNQSLVTKTQEKQRKHKLNHNGLTAIPTKTNTSTKLASFYVEYTGLVLQAKYTCYVKCVLIIIFIYLASSIIVMFWTLIEFELAQRNSSSQFIDNNHDYNNNYTYHITDDKMGYSRILNHIMCFPNFTKIPLQLFAYYAIESKFLHVSSTQIIPITDTKWKTLFQRLMACKAYCTFLILFAVFFYPNICYPSEDDKENCIEGFGIVGCILFIGIAHLLVSIPIAFFIWLHTSITKTPPANIHGMCHRCCYRFCHPSRLIFAWDQGEITTRKCWEAEMNGFGCVTWLKQIFDKSVVIQVIILWVANLLVYFIIRYCYLFHIIWIRNFYEFDSQFVYHHLFGANQCQFTNVDHDNYRTDFMLWFHLFTT